MFYLESGKVTQEWYPKKASTVIDIGYLMYADGSGAILPADSTSGDHVGVAQKAAAATDSDYASTTNIPVLVPNEETVWRVDIGSGTFTTAMIGSQYDLANAYQVDVGNQSKNVVTCVGYVSSSVGLFKVNALITYGNVATT